MEMDNTDYVPECVVVLEMIIEKQPKIGHSERFLIRDGDRNTVIGFSDTLLSIWGRPSEKELGVVIEAYIKKYGFSDEVRLLTSYDVKPSLRQYLHELVS
jgi:hypothetical protein